MDSNYSLSDIAAVTGSNRNNGGMFGGDGDWGAWIILFLLFGLFGRGGFGGGFGGGGGCGAPCATQSDVRAAVDQQTLISKLDQQTYGLADATYALNNAITGGFHGVERQLADCCCTTQRAIDGVNYNMAKGFCDIGNAINMQTRDILENANCNTRAILDFLTNDKIATLTAENQNLKLTASQANQNAVLMAAMDANKAEILRRTGAECPTAAYIVQPPTPVHFPYNNCGCGNNYGYGYAG
ncbi:MAG: hypothetical protein IJZ56_03380 [Oscillospiraceae bacterium]|nr:hypothetical protein [Oscillospiraceae bacterium]